MVQVLRLGVGFSHVTKYHQTVHGIPSGVEILEVIICRNEKHIPMAPEISSVRIVKDRLYYAATNLGRRDST